jgi:hypothetical protein
MNSVIADKTKNRLLITISGVISQAESQDLVSKVVSQTSLLMQGFCTITDTRHFKYGNPDTDSALKNIVEYLVQHNCRYAVRIVGDSKMALAKFKKAAEETKAYPVHYVETLEDAEKLCHKVEASI